MASGGSTVQWLRFRLHRGEPRTSGGARPPYLDHPAATHRASPAPISTSCSGCPRRLRISCANTPSDLNLRCRPATGVERDDHVLEMLDLIPLASDRAVDGREPRRVGTRLAAEPGRGARWRLRAGHVEAEVLPRPSLPPLAARPDSQREPQIEYEHSSCWPADCSSGRTSGIHTIYEIGSGSGNNLWLLSELFPDARIVGLDPGRSGREAGE